MQGYIFDIRHYSVHDGPGIRTTVFFKGCPLRCLWCHNPESHTHLPVDVAGEKRIGEKRIALPETIGKQVSASEVVQEILKSSIFFEESEGGVTFSGGEPLLQPRFLMEIITMLKSENIHIAIDTCGHAPEALFDEVIAHSDLILFDLKHPDPVAHEKHTGVGNELILRNLQSEIMANKSLIVRIPLIPEFNMDHETYQAMADLLAPLHNLHRIDLLPFHRIADHKYKRLGMQNPVENIYPPGPETVESAAGYFRQRNFNVHIGG